MATLRRVRSLPTLNDLMVQHDRDRNTINALVEALRDVIPIAELNDKRLATTNELAALDRARAALDKAEKP